LKTSIALIFDMTQNPAMNRLFAIVLLLACLPAHGAEPERAVTYKELKWQDDVYFLDGKPYNGLARETHKNGQPKGEYTFKEGRLHGVVKEWWDNGQLSTETHFENGQRHGLNRYWSKKGNLMKEQVYDHDKSMSEKHYDVE
jgi:antitoxin component YwqK of YwqJK toxin-antitoxin module